MYQTRIYDPDEKDPMDKMWYPPELPDDKDTILILAGDLWVGYRWLSINEYSWIGRVAPRFKQVLVVLGNHDYWSDIDILHGGRKMNEDLQDMCLFNVKVLDCDTFEVDNKIFVGATLWTDMFKFDPWSMYHMPQLMRPDSKIRHDHGDGTNSTRFTSQRWVDTHIKHRDYIDFVAKENPDKDIIVATHHMPLTVMGDPMYEGYNANANAYYYSDLSNLILDRPNIKFWCAGHSHVDNDFMFEHCRMYMNPVGYQGEHREQEGFVKHEVIEV